MSFQEFLKRRGIVFTIDGAFALLMLLGTIPLLLLVASQPQPSTHTAEYLHALAEDSVDVLSLTRISDVRNEPVVQQLFSQGMLTDADLNHSVLDVLGLYWSANNPGNFSAASNLSGGLLAPLMPASVNWEFDISNDLLYNSSNRTNSSILISSVSRRSASGFSRTAPTTGFVARAFLESLVGTDVSSYFFFGGFVGQGNLTATLYDLPADANFSKLYLELKAGAPFNFYVNGAYCQSMTVTAGNFSVDNWTITAPGCLNALVSGEPNNFSLNFTGGNLSDQYVGGGYLKAVYSTAQLTSPAGAALYYRFPGIQGLVNLYDSLYVPGNLTALYANLTFFTGWNYSTLLWVGNTTVLNYTGNNQTQTVTLTDADFQGNFSANNVAYAQLSNTTVPLRMLVSANITAGLINGTVDIILITDTSGSMAWHLDQDGVNGNVINNCSDPNLYLATTSRVSLAKCLDKDFINAVLGGNASTCTTGTPTPGNRVGLVSFSTNVNNWTNLQTDIARLTSTVDTYAASGSTCLACAINRAYEILAAQSDVNRSKYIVVMTDGVANMRPANACYDFNDLGNGFAVGALGSFAERLPPWTAGNISTSITLNRVSALNSSVARAVANAGQVYRWTGTTWALEQTVGGGANVYGVALWNESLGFAVGASAKIYQWNGLSWSETNDFGSFNFRGVAFLNNSWAFAVGDGGRVYYWNGLAWAAFQTNLTQNLYAVDGVNASRGGPLAFAVGASGRVFRWNGLWFTQNASTGNTHYDVGVWNGTLAFTANSNGRVYAFNGGAWTSTVLQSNALEGMHVFNGTLAYAAGVSATAAGGTTTGDVFEWNGASWQRTNSTFYYSGNGTLGLNCNDDDSCTLDITGSYSALNANYSTARAFSNLNNLTVDSVGFGPIQTCQLGNDTITEIAKAGNGSSYSSANATELKNIYCQIANNIATKQTQTQQILTQGTLQNAILDPSSFIRITYVPDVPAQGYQEVTLNAETAPFPGCDGSFFLPPGLTVTDAKLTSYSGAFWTKGAYLKNALTGNAYQSVYNLTKFGVNYTSLGDPYNVYYPANLLQANATNYVRDELGLNASDVSANCSASDKFLYTFRVRAYAPFSGIFENMNGSNVTVYYDRDHDGIEDGFIYVAIGAGMPGFNATPKNVTDLNPAGNALDDALVRLLDELNFVVTATNSGPSGNVNNPVDVLLSSNVQIETDVLNFVPNVWGPVDMKVVVWK